MNGPKPTAANHPVEEIYLAGFDRIDMLRCEAMVKAHEMLKAALEKRDNEHS